MKHRYLVFGIITAVAMLAAVFPGAESSRAAELPEGFMPLDQSAPILQKTLTVQLSPHLFRLSPAERGAAQKLVEVGEIFQKLYENSRHHQARFAHESIVRIDEGLGSSVETRNLLDLYYLFKGPIARTLDNEYVPIAPVDASVPGKNVYPWGITRAAVDSFLDQHPDERASILGVRTVVRRAEEDALQADLAALEQYPVLAKYHPDLDKRLRQLLADKDEERLYAVPYAVAYANDLVRASTLLEEAAGIVEGDDEAFARYLRLRSQDLLKNDYEQGDAAWVTGTFKNLNAQIGSYEVYDDELYAVKSFFSLSLLIRDKEKSDALASAVTGMQEFEESLPCESHKRVKENIPVGVYNVIADFGQSRGSNTATILPNESYIARKYGRIILIRYNIISNPSLFSVRQRSWDAAMDWSFHADYNPDGDYYRTLWHEIGHYLGPDLDSSGRTLGEALQENSQILEELKADLVSLFLARALHERGYYSDEQLRAVYASGIRRVLLKNRPKRSQTYQTMELMQMNYFLENGLLAFDPATGKLNVSYERYHDVVASMLEAVLALQFNGDKDAAGRFIDTYDGWNDSVHGVVSGAMRATEQYRYVMVRYGVLEE